MYESEDSGSLTSWRGLNPASVEVWAGLFLVRHGIKKVSSLLLLAAQMFGAEQAGQVMFHGLPVPGVTIVAVQGEKKASTVTDAAGHYVFADLADGEWTLRAEMTGFQTLTRTVTVAPKAPAEQWDLQLAALEQVAGLTAMEMQPVRAAAAAVAPAPAKEQAAAAPKETKAEDDNATDGLLINGSTNNGAASPFAQFAAFGNTRSGRHGLYNGSLGMIADTSFLDARPFSLTGQEIAKPSYLRFTGLAALGGPLPGGRLWKMPPYFFLAYQWTRNKTDSTGTGLMPTAEQRDNAAITPAALALLRYYPLPNVTGNSRYNYEVPLVSEAHQDALQSRLNKRLGMKNQIYGRFALQDSRSSTPNLFGFLDTSDLLGMNTEANWEHRFGHNLTLTLGYQFSRLSTRSRPYFENRENVSGLAGIAGNDQAALNWGPPTLTFSSGISGLSDGVAASNHNETNGLTGMGRWYHGRHNASFGGDFRRQQFNMLAQQNPRGSFTFTGAATGSDFGDFLAGIPDAATLAFGNADKYFRQSVYDAYINDDWRLRPELTINAGLRWEYGAPMTELYGRLVNLNIGPNFSSAAPEVGNHSLQADRHGVEPRVAMAWRPISGSSFVVRAGYGVYYDTSVYLNIATQMAQQAPLSKSLSISNSTATPLTMANAFNTTPASTADTFAVDPHFRPGYAQNWQASVQRDLPASLQLTALYLGIQGTHAMQEFLPNTVPSGAASVCAACPVGFVYLAAGGNSTRQAAEVQLRRRLHSGLSASLQYTFAKAIDDAAALGGQGFTPTQSAAAASNTSGASFAVASEPAAAVAQNWLDLRAERSRSSFDQRHVLSAQMQYTTGMGLAGGALATGWRGALLKEWTVAALINAASGLPASPVLLAPVSGTGFTGSLRPDYTGAPLYAAPAGLALNPTAFAAPNAGQWGSAGRNIITGPAQFSLNASMGRTFRVNDRFSLDLRVDSANALNHVTYTAWNTTFSSPLFGLPAAANAMRNVQTTLRLRF